MKFARSAIVCELLHGEYKSLLKQNDFNTCFNNIPPTFVGSNAGGSFEQASQQC